jgi:hypothetical protein
MMNDEDGFDDDDVTYNEAWETGYNYAISQSIQLVERCADDGWMPDDLARATVAYLKGLRINNGKGATA